MGPHVGRRRFLSATGGCAVTGLAGCANGPFVSGAGTDDRPRALAALPETVGLETVVDGIEAPIDVAFAPDADRRYVAQRDGRVVVHESDGLLDDPFLDAREAVVTGGERGLLGIALHPNFAENRRLFCRFSAPRRAGTPEEYDHTDVLAEVGATADGRRVRPDSARTILEIPQPADFHNGGDLAFGPDGYLYVAVGAGGGGGGGGQEVTESLLGSILRIDVDGEDGTGDLESDGTGNRTRGDGDGTGRDSGGGDRAYAVPDDNPLVGRDGLDEYYAWGFRNPWRLSFDEGDLFVGDVGEERYEEVNLVEKGGNYGWNVKEGTHCYREDDCPDVSPEGVLEGDPLLDPIVEYPHPETDDGADVTGVSVIGGYVYRGSALPELEGAYVFGDLVANGRLFVAVRPEDADRGAGESGADGDGGDGGNEGTGGNGGTGGREADGDEEPWPTGVLEVVDGEEKLQRILSFGRNDGEVYVLGGGADESGLFRVVPAE